MRASILFCAALALLAAPAASPAADTTRGAVELSGGTKVPQNPKLPKLNLTDAQRAQIRQVLSAKNSQVEFKLKTTKKAKDFNPQIGAKLPKGVKPLGIPSELTQKIPQLADYGYAKLKDRILIVNAMKGKIAAIVPLPQAQTTGQAQPASASTPAHEPAGDDGDKPNGNEHDAPQM